MGRQCAWLAIVHSLPGGSRFTAEAAVRINPFFKDRTACILGLELLIRRVRGQAVVVRGLPEGRHRARGALRSGVNSAFRTKSVPVDLALSRVSVPAPHR